NYQVWLLVEAGDLAEMKELRKVFGADKCASGAIRMPGSRNCQPHRRQSDGSYPVIRLVGGVAGQIAALADVAEFLPPAAESPVVSEPATSAAAAPVAGEGRWT